jgi:hypothetical protein
MAHRAGFMKFCLLLERIALAIGLAHRPAEKVLADVALQKSDLLIQNRAINRFKLHAL